MCRKELLNVEEGRINCGLYKNTIDLVSFLDANKNSMQKVREITRNVGVCKSESVKFGRLLKLVEVGDDGSTPFCETLLDRRINVENWATESDIEQIPRPCISRHSSPVGTDTLSFDVNTLVIRESVRRDGWALGYVVDPLSTEFRGQSKWFLTDTCEEITNTVLIIEQFPDEEYDFPVLHVSPGDVVVVCGDDEEGWTLGWHRGNLGYYSTEFGRPIASRANVPPMR